MGRTAYWNDPQAPKPNSLVPACGVLATDDEVHIPRQRRRDTGQHINAVAGARFSHAAIVGTVQTRGPRCCEMLR
jgi:hypothetical protein